MPSDREPRILLTEGTDDKAIAVSVGLMLSVRPDGQKAG